MAGAKPAVHVLKIEPISVPQSLQKGVNVFKWDEEANQTIPCNLSVDSNGFYLHWINMTKHGEEREMIEISTIRDTRTRKYAKQIKEAKLKDQSLGDGLEEKTLTIVTANDFVNLTFTTFVFNNSETAQLWADELFKYCRNPMAWNGSVLMYLQRIHTKLLLSTDHNGKIPVKTVAHAFGTHKDDKRRIYNALEHSKLPYAHKDLINPNLFTFDIFLSFYFNLCKREELQIIFENIGKKVRSDNLHKLSLTVEELKNFINDYQRDPRLNEILYPFATTQDAARFIKKYEPDKHHRDKGSLSYFGLLRYLLSEDNLVIPLDHYDESHDMSQPLSHYYINSSHNTYLTGHQMRSLSSAEMYRQTLLDGCRCLELDCWPGSGSDHEPIITHGYTVCSEISYKEVIEAIAESAFKTSEYPVILSFENHVNKKSQQEKMARYCRTIFGDMLLNEPFSDFPLKSNTPLPAPESLRRKILIKNKKRHKLKPHKLKSANNTDKNLEDGRTRRAITASTAFRHRLSLPLPTLDLPEKPLSEISEQIVESPDPESEEKRLCPERSRAAMLTKVDSLTENNLTTSSLSLLNGQHEVAPPRGRFILSSLKLTVSSDSDIIEGRTRDTKDQDRRASIAEIPESGISRENTLTFKKNGLDLEDIDSSSSDEESGLTEDEKQKIEKDMGTALKEATASEEMSSLVNYCTPVHFHSFEHSKKKNRAYELSSFVESAALQKLNIDPIEFVNYNKRQLSRIYPRGTRVDSSNFVPQLFWNAGCQLVALNFQTLDVPMQLNQGIFERNGRTGYLLKPSFMRQENKKFDPFAESTVDGIVAGTVSVEVISGQFLSEKQIGTYVEVEMFGLPADTVKKKFKTKIVPNNGINPQYRNELFTFKKVVLPTLAVLRIVAYEESKKMIGHRILPVDGIRPGYRHISLKNELGQPLLMPTLFVRIDVKDYVPDGLVEFADALSDPIAYQSNLERHQSQLRVLVDDFEERAEDEVKEQDEEASGLGTLKRSRQYRSDDNLLDAESPDTIKAVPLTGSVSHATSLPYLLDDTKSASNSTQNLSLLPAMSMPALQVSNLDDNPLTVTQVQEIQDKFTDDELCGAMTDLQLLTSKQFRKLYRKQTKQLNKLDKFYKKTVSDLTCPFEENKTGITHSIMKMLRLSRESKCDLSKLCMDHMKLIRRDRVSRSHIFKSPQLSWQLIHGWNSLPPTPKLRHEQPLSDEERKHVQHHMAIWGNFYTAERITRSRHIEEMVQTCHNVIEKHQADALKLMNKLHDQQAKELNKLMHSKRESKLRDLSTKHKDKHEFTRIKREFVTKHIERMVESRTWLKDVVIRDGSQKLKSNFDAYKSQLTSDLEERVTRLPLIAERLQRQEELRITAQLLTNRPDVITNGQPATHNGSSQPIKGKTAKRVKSGRKHISTVYEEDETLSDDNFEAEHPDRISESENENESDSHTPPENTHTQLTQSVDESTNM